MIEARFSEAGRCRRQVAYRLTGVPPEHPVPRQARNLMEMGRRAEDVMVNRLLEDGWNIMWTGESQETVTIEAGEVRFRGRPDGVALKAPGLDPVELPRALEVKSVTRWGMREWWEGGLRGWNPDYYAQVILEMAALKVTRAAVMGIARDTGEERVDDVPFDAEAYEAIVVRWADVAGTISGGGLPQPDYAPGDDRCAPERCQWSALCPSGQAFQAMRRFSASRGPAEDGRDDPALSQAALLWKGGDDMERQGRETKDAARRAFEAWMTERKVKALALTGLSVSMVTQNREEIDRSKARSLLGVRWEEVVTRKTMTYLRISRQDE